MFIYPPITLTLLNGFLLILPMIALRYGLPALIHKQALADLDYFPPVEGMEKLALRVYFVANTFLIFSPLLARLQPGARFAAAGWGIYALGLLAITLSLISFSSHAGGIAARGIYRLSRNPMYVGYFLVFIGVALLIGSWFHLALAVVNQAAVHFIILSEERWCLQTYGQDYTDYCKQVRRYI